MTDRHLSVVPDVQPKSPNYGRRVGVGVGLTAGVAAVTAWLGLHPDAKPVKPVTPAEDVCVVSAETHPYTFKAGEGDTDAIVTIEGAGEGAGAFCWNAAKNAVDAKLSNQKNYGNPTPNAGEVIEVPNSIEPKP